MNDPDPTTPLTNREAMRDIFAIAAMFVHGRDWFTIGVDQEVTHFTFAARCYQTADAMLIEWQNQHPGR